MSVSEPELPDYAADTPCFDPMLDPFRDGNSEALFRIGIAAARLDFEIGSGGWDDYCALVCIWEEGSGRQRSPLYVAKIPIKDGKPDVDVAMIEAKNAAAVIVEKRRTLLRGIEESPNFPWDDLPWDDLKREIGFVLLGYTCSKAANEWENRVSRGFGTFMEGLQHIRETCRDGAWFARYFDDEKIQEEARFLSEMCDALLIRKVMES